MINPKCVLYFTFFGFVAANTTALPEETNSAGVCGKRMSIEQNYIYVTYVSYGLVETTENCPPNKKCSKLEPIIKKRPQAQRRTIFTNKCCEDFRLNTKTGLCDKICTSKTCTHGICDTRFNKCQCHVGYSNTNDTDMCKPICLGCTHGMCVKPNVCECIQGYKKDSRDICFPICDPSCKSGLCLAPDWCVCFFGHTLDLRKKNVCKPVCPSGCNNGECVAPNTCKCNDGYMKNSTRCVPVCTKPCVNGKCLMPNKCSCNEGYEMDKNETNICNPICIPKCENSVCLSPGICECHGDHVKDTDNPSKCNPVCKEPCEHGVCSGPNVCTCFEGYQKISENSSVCVPVCSKDCVNGKCVAPDKCECDPGFKKERHECIPTCTPDCINGICTDVNKCTCDPGFVLDLKQTFKCNFECNPPCGNGSCIAPEICNCSLGFKKTEKTNECISNCEGKCTSGQCDVKLGKCICNKGYYEDDQYNCLPICSNGCTNGDCVEPETCKCWDNYELHRSNIFECHKKCQQECVHGKCSPDGTCICFDSYEGDNCTLKQRKVRVEKYLAIAQSGSKLWNILWVVFGVLCSGFIAFVIYRSYQRKCRKITTELSSISNNTNSDWKYTPNSNGEDILVKKEDAHSYSNPMYSAITSSPRERFQSETEQILSQEVKSLIDDGIDTKT